MTSWPECFWDYWWHPKLEKGWKRKPHSTSLIRNQSAAQGATHLAGKNSLMLIELAVEKMEVINPCHKSDVVLVKYRCPLHRRTVKFLTDPAVAYLRIHGIIANFVLHCTAVATCSVLHG